MFTFHETIQLFEYNALGTSGYGPTERRALDDWLIQRIEAIKWDVLHEINSVLRDYAPLNAKSNPRETFTHLEKENSMYLIEFSESHRWHNWGCDDSGHPLVYSSIAEARLALYEDHFESLLDEDVDAAGNMPLDRFSIVREEGDEPAVRWCLTETGTLCKPIPY